jgi:hypothetical protein
LEGLDHLVTARLESQVAGGGEAFEDDGDDWGGEGGVLGWGWDRPGADFEEVERDVPVVVECLCVRWIVFKNEEM